MLELRFKSGPVDTNSYILNRHPKVSHILAILKMILSAAREL